MKKQNVKTTPSSWFDFLIKNGMNEQVALEIDEYTQQKEKRRKRLQNRKEDKWK